VDGGYDAAGNLTRDPAAIEATGRMLPIGFWKGSGLSLMLDLLAAVLSGGRATHEIAADPEAETALSQVFIAIDPSVLSPQDETERIVAAAIAHLHAGDEDVRHPAQRTLETRARSLRDGVAVDAAIWAEVSARAAG
jgi:3-dehydro-L-gulonate 2-dehydrogenase